MKDFEDKASLRSLNNFVSIRIGVRTLLNLMLFLGTALVLLYSTLSVLFDDEIPSYKMCTHHSKEDFQIMQAYLVNFSRVTTKVAARL